MERTIKTGAALCAAGLWMAVHAMAQADSSGGAPAASAAGAAPAVAAEAAADWAQGLCATIEEGARLLAENNLAPANGEAKAALLEARGRAVQQANQLRLSRPPPWPRPRAPAPTAASAAAW